MLQLKSNVTGKIIEVNEIDAHWYNGHEEFKAINVETPQTIETKSPDKTTPKAAPVLKKRGRPRKAH